MATMVTVGGTETGQAPRPPREPRSRGLVLVVIGLVAGLILGALFTGGEPSPVASGGTVVDDPDASPSTTTTTIRVAPERLATIVPGMLDTLVTSAIDRTGMSVVTVWEPSGRNPVPAQLPWGNLTADASRVWMAHGTPGRWVAGRTLWVGNSAYMEPVTSDLLGEPVWHERLPGQLAWIDVSTGSRVLTTGRFLAGQGTVPVDVAEVSDDTGLVGYTDFGLLTMRFDPDQPTATLELWDESGALAASYGGLAAFVGVGRDLIAVTDIEGNQVFLDHTLTPAMGASWADDCWEAVWAPNEQSVLVRCAHGDAQRIELWLDALGSGAPHITFAGEEYGDIGFTSEGIPYVAWGDPFRPATTIGFYSLGGDRVYELSYPGRAIWLESTRG